MWGKAWQIYSMCSTQHAAQAPRVLGSTVHVCAFRAVRLLGAVLTVDRRLLTLAGHSALGGVCRLAPFQTQSMLALNEEYIAKDASLVSVKDGDTIAFIPPLSGG